MVSYTFLWNGSYGAMLYQPTSESDAKAVRNGLRALGIQVQRVEEPAPTEEPVPA